LNNSAFWKSDWIVGLAITALFCLAYLIGFSPTQSLEYKAYDLGVSASVTSSNDHIVILDIDDDSIERIGRWPWPRSVVGDVIRKLSDAGARLVGVDIFYSEKQLVPKSAKTHLQLASILKAQGKIKYLGFTGHQNPYAHAHMLERTAESDIFDTVLMPVNVLDASYYSFKENVMQKALDRNMGILAIKSLADGRFFAKKEKANWTSEDPLIPNYLSIKEAMHFVWSLPVSVLISGNENATFMREKIALARSFSKLTEDQKLALIDKVKDVAMTGELEYFKKKEV
jgi:hypothetical protein